MTGKEPTWTDGDLVAIAAGLECTLGPCWSRLVARDPGLKSFPLRVALSKLRALGLRSDFEHPAGPLGRSGP